MHILADVIGAKLAVDAARRDHRDFLGKMHEAFENAGRAAERAESHGEIGAALQQDLPLAVIAEAAGFQDRRPPQLGDAARQRAGVRHVGEAGGLDPEPLHELLLDEPVLRQRENPGVRPHRLARGEKLGGPRRHIFELVGYDVDRLGEGGQRRLVFISRDRARRADVEGRLVRARAKIRET